MASPACPRIDRRPLAAKLYVAAEGCYNAAEAPMCVSVGVLPIPSIAEQTGEKGGLVPSCGHVGDT
jgi:hypothetical protein